MNERKIGYRDIFKQREFMKTVIADIFNRFGDSIDSIAFTWLVYQVTQSAAWSAIIFGVNRIPSVIIQPFAGTIIEGRKKKAIMVITDIIRGICVGFIATALLLGFVDQWILLATTIVISTAEAFRMPASTALLPKLLDKKYYDFGLSLSKSASTVSELIGLGLAGAVITVTSVSAAIYIDMATFFLSALLMFSLRIKEETLTRAKVHAREYFNNLKEGFLYVKQNPNLSYFMVLAVFLNAVLVPINSLMAPLVSEVLHSTEFMLSLISIALTVGMLLGAMIYPYLSRRLSKRLIISLGGYSIAFIYFSFIIVGKFISSVIWMTIIIAFVTLAAGFAISLLSSFCGVEFVKNIEEGYMARTSAILNAGCVAAMPVVSLFISVVTGITSTAMIFIIAGGLDILICLKLCSKKVFARLKDKESNTANKMTVLEAEL